MMNCVKHIGNYTNGYQGYKISQYFQCLACCSSSTSLEWGGEPSHSPLKQEKTTKENRQERI